MVVSRAATKESFPLNSLDSRLAGFAWRGSSCSPWYGSHRPACHRIRLGGAVWYQNRGLSWSVCCALVPRWAVVGDPLVCLASKWPLLHSRHAERRPFSPGRVCTVSQHVPPREHPVSDMKRSGMKFM